MMKMDYATDEHDENWEHDDHVENEEHDENNSKLLMKCTKAWNY